ncbi:MAG: RHS repeat-associated core domain-containing protein [Ktedonobacteraceae bacterium]
MLLSRPDSGPTPSSASPFHLFRSELRISVTWSTLWRLVMSFLMMTTFVVGMWAGIASQAAVAYAMSQQEAQFFHHTPPVSAAPRRASRVHPASIAACPALTGTPNVGGTGDDNGLGTLSFYTLIKQSLSDQVSLAENVANGNVALQASDLTIHGTGLNLAITSTYNSQSTASGTLGNGWNLSVGNGVTLTPSGNNYILNGPSGFSATYEANNDSYGDFEEPPGLDATLLASSINGASHVIVFQHTGECLGFNSNGYEIFDEDRNSNQITFTYNSSNQLTTITDTQGRLTTLAYDSAGHVKTITDPIGRTVQYSYDTIGNLLTITNMAGNVYTFGYSSGALTSITEPDNQKTTLGYQTGNMITGLTDATSATTGFAYYNSDADQCTNVNNSGLPCTVVTVTPNTTAETTTYLYSGSEVQFVKDANGNMESTTYTPDANVATYTDPLLNQTVYNYDASSNNLMSATDANGATTSFDYDNSNPYQPNKETNPQGDTLSFGYDSNGNLTSVTDSTNGGTGTSVSYTYNSNGTLATSTDGDGNTTSYSYDSFGNLKKVTPPSPLGNIKYTVDGVSSITSITDGKGQVTTFTYDALDHLTKITYNDNTSITYSFDNEGNVTSEADNTGTTTFQYDADNRVTKKTLPGGQTIVTAYDHVGNLATFTDSGGTVTYAYTPVNLVSSITEPNGSQTTFSYNNANERTGETFPNKVNVDLDYDKAGHLDKIIATNSNNQTLIDMQYSYQLPNSSAFSNLLQKMSFQDPVYPSNGTLTWVYSYDTMSRLTGADLLNSNNQEVADFLYSYDKAGNRTQFQQTGNSTTINYSYNAAEELASSTQGSQTTTYSYDANGNLTGSSTGPAYSYNPKNQTTSIGTDSYTYTGTDQTERVQVNSVSYEYSGLGLSAKTNSSGTDYYTRCSCGMLIGERTSGGKEYYYLLDAQESVVGVMDSSGNLIDSYVYDPFGNLFEQNETVANPWQYASGYLDSTTGLYHFGARYYDPTLGRWTQEDPASPTLASPDSLNRYLYVDDSPVNGTDKSGMYSVQYCIAAIFGSGFVGFLGIYQGYEWLFGTLVAGLLDAAAATTSALLGILIGLAVSVIGVFAVFGIIAFLFLVIVAVRTYC